MTSRRKELILAKKNIETAIKLLDGLGLDYHPEKYKLDDVQRMMEEDIREMAVCCICEQEYYRTEMEVYMQKTGVDDVLVCDECEMDGVGVCDCGYPVKHDQPYCQMCGQSTWDED